MKSLRCKRRNHNRIWPLNWGGGVIFLFLGVNDNHKCMGGTKMFILCRGEKQS